MARTISLARRASGRVKKSFTAFHCAGLDMHEAVPAKPASHTLTRGETRKSATQSTISGTNMVSKFSLDSSDSSDFADDSDEEELDITTRVVLPVQGYNTRLSKATGPAAAPSRPICRPAGKAPAPSRSKLHRHVRRDVPLSTIFELHEPQSRFSPPKRDLRREERSDSFIAGCDGLPPVTTTVDDRLESERRRNPWWYGSIVFAFDYPHDEFFAGWL